MHHILVSTTDPCVYNPDGQSRTILLYEIPTRTQLGEGGSSHSSPTFHRVCILYKTTKGLWSKFHLLKANKVSNPVMKMSTDVIADGGILKITALFSRCSITMATSPTGWEQVPCFCCLLNVWKVVYIWLHAFTNFKC